MGKDKDKKDVPAEIRRLADAIAQLPVEYRARLNPLIEQAIEISSRRRRIFSLIQDVLSQLRQDMKYLAFDIEATRRERDNYKHQLEEQGQ